MLSSSLDTFDMQISRSSLLSNMTIAFFVETNNVFTPVFFLLSEYTKNMSQTLYDFLVQTIRSLSVQRHFSKLNSRDPHLKIVYSPGNFQAKGGPHLSFLSFYVLLTSTSFALRVNSTLNLTNSSAIFSIFFLSLVLSSRSNVYH